MEHASYFLSDDYPFSPEAANILTGKEAVQILPAFKKWMEENNRTMDENLFGEMIAELTNRTEQRGKVLFQTLKAALTGRTDGPEIYYLVPVIGNERTIGRIDRAAGLNRRP
jgi:nondiscriminating glutamyl-tRNA synthetase